MKQMLRCSNLNCFSVSGVKLRGFTVLGAMIDDKTYDPRVYYMNHTESNKVKAVAVFMSSVYRVLPLFTK